MSIEVVSLPSPVSQLYAAASALALAVELESGVTTTVGAASPVSAVITLASRIDLEDV